MKVLDRIFGTIVVTILLINVSLNVNAQQVNSLSYSPEFPGLEDTITVYYSITYPSTGCFQDSLHISELYNSGTYQYLIESYTCCIPAPQWLQTYNDSIKIFPDMFGQGYVEIFFMAGYLTTSNCPAFPILFSGDTVSYPTGIQYIEIPVGFVAGETEFNNDFLLNIYPNPVESGINIQFNLAENANITVEVLDMQGKAVHGEQPNHCQAGTITINLDLSDLTNGFYNLRLGIDDTYYFKKFVKR